jgi:hypothetical protein
LFNGIPQIWKDSSSHELNMLMSRTTDFGATSVIFTIPGAKLGTFTNSKKSGGGLITIGYSSQGISYPSTDSTAMTFTITQYDSVGGRIKGTFSGTLGKLVNQTLIMQPVVTVSSGSFDLVRSADQ